MGRKKIASQKEKKAEKAKVKLKGHTTMFLPKGLNVTKTAFKVRKIVLQQQLKTHDGDQPLSKRKLNIKEVLSRLQHYSASQRQEGLVGLTDVIRQMNMEQLLAHLAPIVDSLARNALDTDSKVRKQSAHILTSVFSLVSETHLRPFSAVLGSYLCCAMTHIQLGVQEDSLLLLDALLESAPAIAASSVHQLLPCVLDMISRAKSDHSTRQLSIQLTSNLVSSIWRAKVFGRLQALLVVSLSQRKESAQDSKSLNRAHHTAVTIRVDPKKQFICPIYNSLNSVSVSLSKIFHKSTSSSKHILDDVVQLRGFVEAIMPLMLDSWMEVNPLASQKKNQKIEDQGLQVEPALILHCVVEIIDLLWQHILLWDDDSTRHELMDWFRTTYEKDISRCFGKGFPYAARASISIEDDAENESQGLGRRRKKNENSSEFSLFQIASPFLLKDKDEHSCKQAIEKCVVQNLTLCHLLVNTTKSISPVTRDNIINLLSDYLDQWGGSLLAWTDHLCRTIQSVFERSSTWDCNLNPLISAVISRYHRSTPKRQFAHQMLASKICDLLVQVSFDDNLKHLQRYESFSDWYSNLPSSLSSGTVTIDKLCVLNKLASQNNATFLQGFGAAFTSLLDSVKNFKVVEGENESEKEAGMASLFFWVPHWNDDRLEALKSILVHEECPPTLAKKIRNILLLRKEKHPELACVSSWPVA